jgi:hypothetical protein
MDNFYYGLDFQTHWGLDMDFAGMVEFFLPSQTYNFGTYPIVEIELPLSNTANLELDYYYPYDEENLWVRSDIDTSTDDTNTDTNTGGSSDNNISGFHLEAFAALSLLALSFVVLRNSKKAKSI